MWYGQEVAEQVWFTTSSGRLWVFSSLDAVERWWIPAVLPFAPFSGNCLHTTHSICKAIKSLPTSLQSSLGNDGWYHFSFLFFFFLFLNYNFALLTQLCCSPAAWPTHPFRGQSEFSLCASKCHWPCPQQHTVTKAHHSSKGLTSNDTNAVNNLVI